jgi:hypothetical protein
MVDPSNSYETDWTIMLYIAADGTLANFGVESLKQVNRAVLAPLNLEQLSASISKSPDLEQLAKSVRTSLNLSQSNELVRAALVLTQLESFRTTLDRKQLNESARSARDLTQLKEPVLAALTTVNPATVVVAAQFSVDAPSGQPKRRYIFDDPSKENLADNKIDDLGSFPPNMTEQEALVDFLKWVYENEKCKSKHYALILWSHGPELFLQPPLDGNTGDSASLYLTPEDLSSALASQAPKPLDIIGFDACSMSMFEMAYELNGLAKLMIASQDDVPDASFPYYDLVRLFRERGRELGSLLDALESPTVKDLNDLVLLLTAGVQEYLKSYQDYVVGKSTGMVPVTLSVLNLAECDPLMKAIRSLACALLKSNDDSELSRALIQARKNAQDYAGGLYVDLQDFCTKLDYQLMKTKEPQNWHAITKACSDVKRSTSSPFILINGAVTEAGKTLINENTTANHGISIYLPYLTNQQFDERVDRPMVKGGRGTNGAKGLPDLINGTATKYLLSARHSLILTTESYYGDLQLAKETAWYRFITDRWTKAINGTDPDPDFHYSARQIEINLLPRPVNEVNPCEKTGTSANSAT